MQCCIIAWEWLTKIWWKKSLPLYEMLIEAAAVWLCLFGSIRGSRDNLNHNLRSPEINELRGWRVWVIFGRAAFVICRLQLCSKGVHNECVCAWRDSVLSAGPCALCPTASSARTAGWRLLESGGFSLHMGSYLKALLVLHRCWTLAPPVLGLNFGRWELWKSWMLLKVGMGVWSVGI